MHVSLRDAEFASLHFHHAVEHLEIWTPASDGLTDVKSRDTTKWLSVFNSDFLGLKEGHQSTGRTPPTFGYPLRSDSSCS